MDSGFDILVLLMADVAGEEERGVGARWQLWTLANMVGGSRGGEDTTIFSKLRFCMVQL